MLNAASSGQRFVTPESGKMKDKCSCRVNAGTQCGLSLFHRAFFNSIMDKTPTHALFTQHYISLAC